MNVLDASIGEGLKNLVWTLGPAVRVLGKSTADRTKNRDERRNFLRACVEGDDMWEHKGVHLE